MKILFITSRLYHPVRDGRSFTLNSYINSLSLFGDVYVASFFDKDDDKKNSFLEIKKLVFLSDSSFISKIWHVLLLSVFFHKPLQESVIYSRKNSKIINSYFDDIKPDVVIFDMIRSSCFFSKRMKKAKTILDMDDILSKRYQQSVGAVEPIIGAFSKKLPNAVSSFLSNKSINRLITNYEFKAMEKEERRASQKFDAIVLVSPKEVNSYNQKYRTNKAICWPVVISEVSHSKKEYQKTMLSFFGNLFVAQNKTTFAFIENCILPTLPNDFSLQVIGNSPDYLVKQYSSKRTLFYGFVKDPKKILQNSLALLAPIQYGSGIKIKIIESMSYGVPVITTPIGAEGIALDSGLLVCNSPIEFKDVILRLSSDTTYRASIVRKNLISIKKNNSPHLLQEAIKKTLISLEKK